MKASVTTGNSGLYQDPYGDQDTAASSQQVPGVYQPSAKNDVLAGLDVDQNHGGVNQTVQMADGAAGTTVATVHESSAPTPADMGIKGASAF